MTPLQASEAIAAAVIDGLGSTPVTLDGERYVPVNGTAWVRLKVDLLPGGGMSIGAPGARRATRRGAVYVQAFTPYGTDDGTAAGLTLAQAVRALLEGLDITDAAATEPKTLNFTDATIRPVRVDGAWLMATVEAPFTFVEIV